MKKEELYASLLDELMYEPETGKFYWLTPQRGRKHIAGTVSSTGHWVITYQGEKITGSRLAWFAMTGTIPEMMVSYKDRNPLNIRWDNLYQTTQNELINNYKEKSDQLNKKPPPSNSRVKQNATFSNAEVKSAVEEFIKDKVLIDGRYLSSKTITN